MSVPDWTVDAKCAGMNTEWWYPPRERGTYKVIADKAKSICRGLDGHMPCPVRLACLGDAFDRHEQFGIFGGLSNRERNALVRKADAMGVAWQDLTLSDRERGLEISRTYLDDLEGTG